MNRRIARTRPPGRLARLMSPMSASVVGALFPLPRRFAPIHRPVVVQRNLQLPRSLRTS